MKKYVWSFIFIISIIACGASQGMSVTQERMSADIVPIVTTRVSFPTPTQTKSATESPNLRVELPTQSTQPTEESMTNLSVVRTQTQLSIYISQAKTDLASLLEIPESDISVKQSQFVTWRDGSIGCPKPGMMYTQALVPGYLIELKVGKKIYHYHGGNNRPPVFCNKPARGGYLPETRS
ncbi:MAG: hypothetical protein B6242_04550 [Anaerolineaceae bacterium 4572_78]|nr:MAG: hypothetical protein B6242_04550 [Anaerolineaceae bacterium 4572_78]